MKTRPDPQFDVYRKLDKPEWVISVTWGHTLRHEIADLNFDSEKAATRWIEKHSSLWLAVQDVPRSVLPISRKGAKPRTRSPSKPTRHLHQEYAGRLANAWKHSGLQTTEP